MYSTIMLTLRKKELLSSTLKCILERQYATSNSFSMRSQFRQFSKDVDRTSIFPTSPNPNSIFNESEKVHKFFKILGINRNKYRIMSLGYLLYGNILDTIDYPEFFKVFNLPDTFFSWFLVTELHVWMLMVRYMGEGKDGKAVRDNMLEAMWIDIDGRISKVCPIDSRSKRKQLLKLTGQFYSALLYYDEGILSDDKILAGALWTIFFVAECNDPEKIEKLLLYVRKQVYLLDRIPTDDAFCNPHIKWIKLNTLS